MEALIALHDDTVVAYDQEWSSVFPLMAPVHLFGGTEMLIEDEECEAVDSGMLVRMNSPFYPPMLCLVTTSTLSSTEKRKPTGREIVRDKAQVCRHAGITAVNRYGSCRSCFRQVWVDKAQQVKIEHECLQVKGRPLWMK